MRRVGFLLRVKVECLDEYRRHHEAVWPEMLTALRQAGWHNYSLFLHESGLLFGYFETPESLEVAQAAMQELEVNARWQTLMAPYFELPLGQAPDAGLVALEEIFHLD